ncbi:MAG: glycosyltransferase [Hyphococcus sp.]
MYAILIPAYQPDRTLVELTTRLARQLAGQLAAARNAVGLAGIVIVNDGSNPSGTKHVFDACAAIEGVHVIAHDVNGGKGAALKTGIAEIVRRFPEAGTIVTADADGQHAVDDILAVAREAEAQRAPVIGARQFGVGVPLRSRVGNIASRILFRLFSGVAVSDTQSGLRAYAASDAEALLGIREDGYEFEFQALFMLARQWGKRLREVPIETIYEPGNPTSHFNPLIDSIKIYAVLLRYVSISALSSLIDFLVFSLLAAFHVGTLTALVISRLVSAPLYFFGMRNVVFKSDRNPFTQAMMVAGLMAFHIVFLWRFIDWLHGGLGAPRSLAMALGVSAFFIFNFLVQRLVIFRPKP